MGATAHANAMITNDLSITTLPRNCTTCRRASPPTLEPLATDRSIPLGPLPKIITRNCPYAPDFAAIVNAQLHFLLERPARAKVLRVPRTRAVVRPGPQVAAKWTPAPGQANSRSCFSSWPLVSRASCSMRSNGTCSALISERCALIGRTRPSCTRWNSPTVWPGSTARGIEARTRSGRRRAASAAPCPRARGR